MWCQVGGEGGLPPPSLRSSLGDTRAGHRVSSKTFYTGGWCPIPHSRLEVSRHGRCGWVGPWSHGHPGVCCSQPVPASTPAPVHTHLHTSLPAHLSSSCPPRALATWLRQPRGSLCTSGSCFSKRGVLPSRGTWFPRTEAAENHVIWLLDLAVSVMTGALCLFPALKLIRPGTCIGA